MEARGGEPSERSDRKLTFFDFPGEIRNQIYHLALVSSEPLALKPEIVFYGTTRYARHASPQEMEHAKYDKAALDPPVRFSEHVRLVMLDWKNGNHDIDRLPSFLHALSRIHIRHALACSLLRSSRALRSETLEIFYTQNTWVRVAYEGTFELYPRTVEILLAPYRVSSGTAESYGADSGYSGSTDYRMFSPIG